MNFKLNFKLNKNQILELANRIMGQINEIGKKNGKFFSPIYESICFQDEEDATPEISLSATIYNYEDGEVKDAIMCASISIFVTDFAISVFVPGEINEEDISFFKIYYQFMSEQFDNYLPELRKFLIKKKFNSMKEYYQEYKSKEREIVHRYKKFDDLLSEIDNGQNIKKN